MNSRYSNVSFHLSHFLKIFRDFLEQPEQDEMPHAINVTPEEQEAIGRVHITQSTHYLLTALISEISYHRTVASFSYVSAWIHGVWESTCHRGILCLRQEWGASCKLSSWACWWGRLSGNSLHSVRTRPSSGWFSFSKLIWHIVHILKDVFFL